MCALTQKSKTSLNQNHPSSSEIGAFILGKSSTHNSSSSQSSQCMAVYLQMLNLSLPCCRAAGLLSNFCKLSTMQAFRFLRMPAFWQRKIMMWHRGREVCLLSWHGASLQVSKPPRPKPQASWYSRASLQVSKSPSLQASKPPSLQASFSDAILRSGKKKSDSQILINSWESENPKKKIGGFIGVY